MFCDFDWPLNASRGFVRISWASCSIMASLWDHVKNFILSLQTGGSRSWSYPSPISPSPLPSAFFCLFPFPFNPVRNAVRSLSRVRDRAPTASAFLAILTPENTSGDNIFCNTACILACYAQSPSAQAKFCTGCETMSHWQTGWGHVRIASPLHPGTGRYSDKCFWKGATNTNSNPNRNLNPNPTPNPLH